MSTKMMFAAMLAGMMAFTTVAQAQETAPKSDKAAEKDGSKEKSKDKAVKGKDKDKDKAKGVAVGDAAPDFKLTDTDGKEHSLAELTKSGKIVVLQWFNAECPYVKKHYGDAGNTFNDLHTKYNSKDVVIVAINSNGDGMPGSGQATNAAAKKDWKIAYPILLDASGDIGRAYGAKNTPAMYIVGKDGKVAYMGAIDDDNGADKPGKTNYVANALDQLIAGETVSTSQTKPYGCGVKYSKQK